MNTVMTRVGGTAFGPGWRPATPAALLELLHLCMSLQLGRDSNVKLLHPATAALVQKAGMHVMPPLWLQLQLLLLLLRRRRPPLQLLPRPALHRGFRPGTPGLRG